MDAEDANLDLSEWVTKVEKPNVVEGESLKREDWRSAKATVVEPIHERSGKREENGKGIWKEANEKNEGKARNDKPKDTNRKGRDVKHNEGSDDKRKKARLNNDFQKLDTFMTGKYGESLKK